MLIRICLIFCQFQHSVAYKISVTYPSWATCPRFPRVGLFVTVLSAFFHTSRLCVLSASMFHDFKSSVTVALHVLRGLPLPLKPSISKWVHLFIYLSFLSTCPYFLRRFNLSFDSKGARFNRPYIVDRLTLSSAFIFSIQRNIVCSLRKRCCTFSLRRGELWLAWIKVPLTQLSYNFPRLAKDIVVGVRRGSSSQALSPCFSVLCNRG